MTELKKQLCAKLNIKTLHDIPDDYIDVINASILKQKAKIDASKVVLPVIDQTTEKYKIILKLVNLILVKLNLPKITNLREFKNIDRLDLIKQEHVDSYRTIEQDIYKIFDKNVSGYYKRASPHIVLLVLKGMCKNIGLKLFAIRKTIQINFIHKTHMIYSIT